MMINEFEDLYYTIELTNKSNQHQDNIELFDAFNGLYKLDERPEIEIKGKEWIVSLEENKNRWSSNYREILYNSINIPLKVKRIFFFGIDMDYFIGDPLK